MRKRERIKSVLLVLLSVSAALLLYFTIRTEVARLKDFGGASFRPKDREESAVFPLYLVVSEGGQRQLLYGGGLSVYFDFLAPWLEEAAVTAQMPSAQSAAEFRNALYSPGILLGYGGKMALAALLPGGNAFASYHADVLFLSAEGETVTVWGRDLTTNTYFSAETGLESSNLFLKEPPVGAEPCRLALDDKAFSFLPPDSPVPLEPFVSRKVTAYPLLTGTDRNRWIQTALPAFAADPYTTHSYPDDAGGRVYLSEYGSIRFGADGILCFAAETEEGLPLSLLSPAAQSGERASVRAAVAAVSALLEPFSGHAEGFAFQFLTIEEENDALSISVGYTVYGRPLIRENGSRVFAHFTFRHGRLVAAELLPLTGRAEEKADLPPYSPGVLAAMFASAVKGKTDTFLLLPAFLQQEDESYLLDWCLLPVLPAAGKEG